MYRSATGSINFRSPCLAPCLAPGVHFVGGTTMLVRRHTVVDLGILVVPGLQGVLPPAR